MLGGTNPNPIITPRVEQVIFSDEVALRQEKFPSLDKRREIEMEWTKATMKKLREEQRKEALQKRWEKKILMENGILLELEAKRMKEAKQNKVEGDDEEGNEETASEKASETQSIAEVEEEEEEENIKQTGELDDEEFAILVMEMKETKLIKQRNPWRSHKEVSMYDRMKLALKFSMGMMTDKDPDLSEILPWMYLGTGSLAKKNHELSKHSFTHILNCTDDVDNFHEDQFVYKRLNIVDSEDADYGVIYILALLFLSLFFSFSLLFVFSPSLFLP